MTQQELEALLAQIAPGGDGSRLRHTEKVEPRKVSRMLPGALEATETTVNVVTHTWYDPATGQAIRVDVDPDTGAYTKTFQGIDKTLLDEKPPTTLTPAQQQTQQIAATDAQKEQDEKSWNAAHGGLWETHAARKTRETAEQAANQKTTTVQVPRNGKSYLVSTTIDRNGVVIGHHVYDEQGQETKLPDENPDDVQQIVKGGDGKVYIQHTVKKPDGNTEIYHTDQQGNRVQLPGEGPKDTTRTVEGSDGKTYIQHSVAKPDGTSEIYFTDQQGNRTTLPDKPGTYTPLPAGVPRFAPDFSKPDLGIMGRRAELDALVGNNTITKEQAASVMAMDLADAKTSAENIGASVSIQQANRSAALGEAQSRRGFAGTLYGPAANYFTGAKVLPGGGNAAAGGMLALLGAGMQLARQMGALPDFTQSTIGAYPLLYGFGQQTAPGLPTPPGMPAAQPSGINININGHPATPASSVLTPPAAPPTAPAAPLLGPPPPVDPTGVGGPQGQAGPDHASLVSDMMAAGMDPDVIARVFGPRMQQPGGGMPAAGGGMGIPALNPPGGMGIPALAGVGGGSSPDLNSMGSGDINYG